MRARTIGLAALAVAGCFIVGLAVGLWLFALVGGHLVAVSRLVLVAGGAAGCLGAWATRFATVRLAWRGPARVEASPVGNVAGGTESAEQT